MKWLLDILNYWKTITGVILSTAALITLAYTAGTKAERKQTQQTEISVGFETLQGKVDSFVIDQSYFQKVVLDSIAKISMDVRQQGHVIGKMKTSQDNLKDYMMKKAATKDDLLEVVNIFDEKKNSNPMGLVRLE